MTRYHPVWLYPNLLALDAPIVAIVWQVFLARTFRVELPLPAVTGLFAAVWLIYLVDRLLDAGDVSPGTSDRHRFTRRNRSLMIGLALLAGVLGVCAGVCLPNGYLLAGCIVAAFVAAYLVVVHRLRPRWFAVGGKELLVGVVFAAGVAVPLIADVNSLAWLPGVVAFGLLCWWNCRLIDRWEVKPDAGRTLGRMIGAAAVIVSWFSPWAVWIAVASAAVALAVVDLAVPRVGVRAARVLADAVLLTPLLFWAVHDPAAV